jgi:hypothetical protein
MKSPKGFPKHQCAPSEWRNVSDMTGSYELDGTIARNPNKDMKDRLSFYLDSGRNAYGPLSAYNGYHNYSGDS